MNNEEIISKIEKLRRLPLKNNSHLYQRYKGMNIGEAAIIESKNYGRNQRKRPAIALIEVILSINRNYASHVELHILRIENSDLNTFSQLKQKIENFSKEEFYNYWGHRNSEKYQILLDVMSAIETLRQRYKTEDDYELMNMWAKDADINYYNDDVIGRIYNIGLATFQHLRMNYGINTVKPDRQVKRVLKEEFDFKGNDKKAILMVEKLSNISGYSLIELDQIFVNYGSGYFEKNETKKAKFICKN